MRVIFVDISPGCLALLSVRLEARMSLLDPCLIRRSTAGGVQVRLGVQLLDDYLEFVAARCRPNTVLAETGAPGLDGRPTPAQRLTPKRLWPVSEPSWPVPPPRIIRRTCATERCRSHG